MFRFFLIFMDEKHRNHIRDFIVSTFSEDEFQIFCCSNNILLEARNSFRESSFNMKVIELILFFDRREQIPVLIKYLHDYCEKKFCEDKFNKHLGPLVEILKPPLTSQHYRELGMQYWNKKEYLQAGFQYGFAIGAGNPVVEDYFRRGRCFCIQEKHDLAIQDFSSAIDRQPDHPEYYFYRGQCLIHADCEDKWSKSIEDFNRAIEFATDKLFKAQCYIEIGKCCDYKEDYQKAIRYKTIALELNATKSSYFYELGKSYVWFKDIRKAKLYIKKAADMGHKKAQIDLLKFSSNLVV